MIFEGLVVILLTRDNGTVTVELVAGVRTSWMSNLRQRDQVRQEDILTQTEPHIAHLTPSSSTSPTVTGMTVTETDYHGVGVGRSTGGPSTRVLRRAIDEIVSEKGCWVIASRDG